MLFGRMPAKVLFQPFGYDMTSVSNQQFGSHLVHFLFGHGIERRIEILHGNARNRPVADMLRQPCKMFIQQFGIPLFKQIDKIHLPHHNHTLPVFIHAVDEFVIIAVVNVQPLIAGDDAYLVQRLPREIEQRLGNGHIDMYRSFSVMVGFQQGFIYQSVAEPLILLRMNFGKVDGFLDQRPEHLQLRKRLSVHLSYPSSRAVGGDDYQGNFLIKGLRHSRVEIQQGGSRSTAHRNRLAAIQSQAEGEIPRTPLIRHCMANKARVIGQSMYDGGIAAARAQHDPGNSVRLEKRCQLEYILFVCIHGSVIKD